MVCLVEAQHIMTFTLDYVFELIWVSSLFVLLFSLNLGAIIALETAAFCVYVCVCVLIMSLYKGIQTYGVSVCQRGI